MEDRLAESNFSKVEKNINDLTLIQKELLDIQFEVALLKAKVEEVKHLALIEDKIYSNIKKFFK